MTTFDQFGRGKGSEVEGDWRMFKRKISQLFLEGEGGIEGGCYLLPSLLD